ncbi:hypothetical protein DFH08DRAFT_1028196 [Mycena albidolilacea]|uniref:Uncharacterized protein n=1 Tax=Mycena albidolilacea TaxID=1033008 RepID=A0AAD6ZJR4_9AGAR|nr:hypothetical protein DFH08DRAFT_1028196 [Mycena albidolilacea]
MPAPARLPRAYLHPKHAAAFRAKFVPRLVSGEFKFTEDMTKGLEKVGDIILAVLMKEKRVDVHSFLWEPLGIKFNQTPSRGGSERWDMGEGYVGHASSTRPQIANQAIALHPSRSAQSLEAESVGAQLQVILDDKEWRGLIFVENDSWRSAVRLEVLWWAKITVQHCITGLSVTSLEACHLDLSLEESSSRRLEDECDLQRYAETEVGGTFGSWIWGAEPLPEFIAGCNAVEATWIGEQEGRWQRWRETGWWFGERCAINFHQHPSNGHNTKNDVHGPASHQCVGTNWLRVCKGFKYYWKLTHFSGRGLLENLFMLAAIKMPIGQQADSTWAKVYQLGGTWSEVYRLGIDFVRVGDGFARISINHAPTGVVLVCVPTRTQFLWLRDSHSADKVASDAYNMSRIL